MATIAEVRKKYPQYADLSDQQLADALHKKFYADMPKADFYGKVGLSAQPAARPAPAAASQAAPAVRSLPNGQVQGRFGAKPTAPLAGSRQGGILGAIMSGADEVYRTVVPAVAAVPVSINDAAVNYANAVMDVVGAPKDAAYRPKPLMPFLDKAIPEPVGIGSQVSRDIAPYLLGTTGVARGLTKAAPAATAALERVAGGAPAAVEAAAVLKAAPKVAAPVRTGIAAGAPVDYALSQTQDSNLSNLVAELGGPQLPTARAPDDTPIEAGVKDMTEGAVVGGLAEKLLDAFMAGRRSVQVIPQDPVAAAPVEDLPPAFAEDVTPAPNVVVEPVDARPVQPAPSAVAPAVGPTKPEMAVDGTSVPQPEVKADGGPEVPEAQGQPVPAAPAVAENSPTQVAPEVPVQAAPPPAVAAKDEPVPVAQALEEAKVQAEGPPVPVQAVNEKAPPVVDGASDVPVRDPNAPDQPPLDMAPSPGSTTLEAQPRLESPQDAASAVGRQDTPLDIPATQADAPAVTMPETVAAPPKLDAPAPDVPMKTAGADDFDAEAFYAKTFGKDAKPIKGTKLYSNPADPEAVKELLVDPAVKVIKKEVDGFKADFAQVRQDLRGIRDNFKPKEAGDTVARTVRKVWWSNTAAIRAVAAKHKDVPEIQALADKIGTDPGRGRVVDQTYERAVQMRAMGMSNRLSNLLGDKVKPEFEARVADALAGRLKPVGGTAEEETARRVRKLLDEQHDYMTAAGLDVGYVKGRYYPRVVDEQAVLADPLAFKAKATEVYKLTGLDDEAAAAAADDWYDRILGVKTGSYASGLPTSNATKGRTLPPEADAILSDFYEKDPRRNLINYFRQTSRAAEFARSFGKNGEKVDELFNAMLKKGVPAAEVDSLRHHFESAAGLLYSTRPDAGAAALGWIQTAGVLRLLPRAVISSATEGLAAGVRAHDVGAGFKAMADSYGILFGLDDAADVKQTAEFLGIVGDAMNDMVLSAQFGGEIGGLAQQKLLSRFFRTTQLHQITEAQRLAATRVGQGMIRTLLQDVSSGNKRAASAQRLLNELGIDEANAKAVSAWLGENGGAPRLADLMGDKPAAKAYRTALQRFVDESIQNPTAADRPQWANHPFGRLAYGITSFMFSYTRNVLIRTGRETAEGLNFGKNYTLEDRARLLTPAIALGVLTAAQSQVSELREMAFAGGAKDEKTDTQRIVQNLSRSGAFGNVDPFINIAMSARYNRDLTSTLTGPYLTAYLDSISKMTVGLIPKELGGPNTPNTNNAEWQAAKAGYEMVAAPLIAAAASYAPGGPVLRVGYGAGLVTATAPAASRGFADAVAGERDVKPRAQDAGDSDTPVDEPPAISYDPEEPGEEN